MAKSSNKTLLVFDFDYTLFDPEKWRKLTYARLAALYGQDYHRFKIFAQKAYNISRESGYFQPKLFLSELIKLNTVPVTYEKLLAAIYDGGIMHQCYYPESEAVIRHLAENYELGIFSTNETSFFRAKFDPIKQYFNKDFIFISHDKKKIISKLDKLVDSHKLIIIDDLIEILKVVYHRHSKVFTVWIKREPYAVNASLTKDFLPYKIITNLDELMPIVKSIP